jgi:hypothetical protein
VRRTPAVAVLTEPPLAVWAGEVLLLVGVATARPLEIARALGAAGRGRVWVAYVSSAGPAGADALAARAGPAAAVVAAVDLPAADHAWAAVEALRRAVARAAPCRCLRLWGADARVVPLSGPQ